MELKEFLELACWALGITVLAIGIVLVIDEVSE